MVKTRVSILPGLGLVPGCDGQTDRHGDKNMIASTRLALRAVLSPVKSTNRSYK